MSKSPVWRDEYLDKMCANLDRRSKAFSAEMFPLHATPTVKTEVLGNIEYKVVEWTTEGTVNE